MLAFVFLLLSTLLGFVLFKSIFDNPKNLEDSIFSVLFSLSSGIFFSTWLIVLVSFLMGFSEVSILFASLTILGFVWFKRKNLNVSFSLKSTDKSFFVIFSFFAVMLIVLNYLAFEPRGDSFYSVGNTWGDYPFHIALTTTMASGNFPPSYPIFPAFLGYPFLSDFFLSILMKLGMPLFWSLFIPNVIFLTSLIAFVYRFAKEMVGKAAVFVPLLFLLNGNLAFLFATDFSKDIMNMPAKGMWFMNVITAIFLPQRSALFGFVISLMIYLLLFYFLRKKEEKYLWFAMVLLGLLPMFHMHSFLFATIVTFILFLFHFDKKWITPGVLAFLLALPQIAYMSGQAHGEFFGISIGWLANTTNILDILLFWLKNLGLVAVLIPIAYLRSPKELKRWYLPSIIIFLIANVVTFQPYVWDNIKLFVPFLFFSAVLISPLLLAIYKKSKILSAAIVLLCIFSSLFSLFWLFNSSAKLYSSADIATAGWIRENTPEGSIFLTSDKHNHPVLLAGRKVVMGYTGWLWSHGFDYSNVSQDVVTMFEDGNADLMRKYNVSYVYFGRDEEKYSLSEKIKEMELVLETPVKIYKVSKPE